MSTIVMSACWPLQMPPVAKSVLIALADNANDRGECWPSIPTICLRTCFRRTAVMDAIAWLEAHGLVFADRLNGRHSTYRIRVDPASRPRANQSAKRTGSGTANPSATQTGPGDGPVRQTDHTSPPRGPDQSARRTLTVKEPSGNRHKSKPRDLGKFALPEWLDRDAWRDWSNWRGRRAGWTARAKTLSLNTLSRIHDGGGDPRAVIDQSIERGWTGLFPVHSNSEVSHGTRQPKKSLADQFLERAASAGRDAMRLPLDPDDREVRPSLDLPVR